MGMGHKKHVRVSGSANQRLKAARKSAAKLEAEQAADKEEDVEDGEGVPLDADEDEDEDAVDDHSGGVFLDQEDVTESDSENDEVLLPVEDTGEEYSEEQEATDDDGEEDDSTLSTTVDDRGDGFDDTDDLDEDEFSDEELEELHILAAEAADMEDLEQEAPNGVKPTRSYTPRRSAALPEGYPLVEWEVVDALGADGDWLSRWHIQSNPPTLVLYQTETGQQIEMKLTRKVARDLDYSIHGIMSIYEEGIAYPEPRRNPVEWVKGQWRDYLEWMKEHKFLGTVTSAISLALVLVLVSSLVGTSLVSLLGGGILGGS